MKEEGLPTLFFVYPEDKFSNDIIVLNSEKGIIDAKETRVQYEKKFLRVWETGLDSLKLLWKNRVSIPGFKFKVYANINDRVQLWKLLGSHKKARAAKARKALKKIGQRRMAQKRQSPPE